MFKKITTVLAASSLLALGATASAQLVDYQGQPPSPNQVAPQSAGGFGATTMWAYIQADGSHDPGYGGGGSGLANSGKLNPGQYEVIFKRGVHNNCVFIGTLSAQASNADHGFIDVVRRSGNTKGLFVETKDGAGAETDMPFAVLVSCAR